MTKPVALVFYENLLAGSQLVNRLQDVGYQVQLVSDLHKLVEQATDSKPMVFVINLASASAAGLEAIGELRSNAATKHIPVLALVKAGQKKLADQVRAAGAASVAIESAVTTRLPQLLDRVLEVE